MARISLCAFLIIFSQVGLASTCPAPDSFKAVPCASGTCYQTTEPGWRGDKTQFTSKPKSLYTVKTRRHGHLINCLYANDNNEYYAALFSKRSVNLQSVSIHPWHLTPNQLYHSACKNPQVDDCPFQFSTS